MYKHINSKFTQKGVEPTGVMSSYASFILPFAPFTSLLCKSTIVLLFEEVSGTKILAEFDHQPSVSACNDRTTKHRIKKSVEGGGGVICVA
jgi:hypothetical protein